MQRNSDGPMERRRAKARGATVRLRQDQDCGVGHRERHASRACQKKSQKENSLCSDVVTSASPKRTPQIEQHFLVA
jgi:hypothetical protein